MHMYRSKSDLCFKEFVFCVSFKFYVIHYGETVCVGSSNRELLFMTFVRTEWIYVIYATKLFVSSFGLTIYKLKFSDSFVVIAVVVAPLL